MKSIIIREEKEADWYETEYVTKKAFWNLHVPGCDEHYLVHILRSSDDYIPELSRVAELEGKIVGTIMYSKAYVMDGDKRTDVITFGPLCIDPEYQKKGIGGELLENTMQLAREKGYRAIIIFGEPEYYPRHGFKPCDCFNITTKDGKNFNAFMGIELVAGGLDGVKGKFFESKVFDDCSNEEAAEEYDKKFPYMEKLKLPGQWI
ncbi:MAG TPA: N-acetyltransferase [Clostridia bacterium]|nr:N-acetyltransferase [Clostridia bacterium]